MRMKVYQSKPRITLSPAIRDGQKYVEVDLGIVRSLVEENGGRIAITRREDLSGRGLRVTLCFDLDAEGLKAQSAPETDPADKSAAQGSPNV